MKTKQQSRKYRFTYKPSAKARLAAHTTLAQFLIDEIKYGSSLTRLYATLLMRTILAEQPELRAYPKFADYYDDDNTNKPREPRVNLARNRRTPRSA